VFCVLCFAQGAKKKKGKKKERGRERDNDDDDDDDSGFGLLCMPCLDYWFFWSFLVLSPPLPSLAAYISTFPGSLPVDRSPAVGHKAAVPTQFMMDTRGELVASNLVHCGGGKSFGPTTPSHLHLALALLLSSRA
jgi:hypothetical protein